ncbi:MAG: hypothetical protein U9R08_01020 [Nanoarchaeota archaeon]|nr:hypothetical protein [Nanoarchaeota archaeon]
MLVSLDAVEDMFTNSIIESNDMYLTIDVARYGGDRIVFNV